MRTYNKNSLVSSKSISSIATLLLLALATTSNVLADETSALAKKLKQLKQKQRVSSVAGESEVDGNPTYKKMLQSVCLIEIGDEESITHGTGWVVDAEQRLIVTNHHVIEGWLDCDVYFPEFVNGKLITDPDKSIREDRARYATVIDSDESVDLALIQLEEALPKGVTAMELADESARPGQNIHSIAGSPRGSASLWIYSTGHARQVGRGTLANDYEAQVLESDMATNQGNSGGPVCDDKGRVVAVVEGHRTDARLVSIYVDLQSLVEYLSDGLRCVNPQSVEDLKFTADRHSGEGRNVVAAKLLTRALKLEPKSAELFALRGWCWYYVDDSDSSQADFEEAIKLDPTYADAHCGLSTLAAEVGKYQLQIKHLTNAIRNDPESTWYRVDRGDAHRRLGEYDEARRDLESALDRDSEDSDAIRRMAMLELDLNNYQVGIDYLNEIFEEYDDDPETLWFGAVGMQGLGEFETAYKLSSLALNEDPEYGLAHLQKGVALSSLDRFPEAVVAFEKADELIENDANIKFCLAIALIQSDRIDEGKALLAKAHRMAPEDETIKEVYENLGQSQVASSNVPDRRTRTQPVGINQGARKHVGTWSAVLKMDRELIKIDLTLRANGTYTGKFDAPGPVGRQTDVDTGAYAIRGNELVLQPNDTGAIIKRPIRWNGNRLELFNEKFQAWLQFSRSN